MRNDETPTPWPARGFRPPRSKLRMQTRGNRGGGFGSPDRTGSFVSFLRPKFEVNSVGRSWSRPAGGIEPPLDCILGRYGREFRRGAEFPFTRGKSTPLVSFVWVGKGRQEVGGFESRRVGVHVSRRRVRWRLASVAWTFLDRPMGWTRGRPSMGRRRVLVESILGRDVPTAPVTTTS